MEPLLVSILQRSFGFRHEGRNWYTSHRGRLWIASTAKAPHHQEIKDMEDLYRTIKEGCYSFILIINRNFILQLKYKN